MSHVVSAFFRITEGSTTLQATDSYTLDTVQKISDAIPTATVDRAYAVSFPVASLKIFGVTSDQDITIKTNSSGAPQETITVLANKVKKFQFGDTAMFAGNVTSIFVTNASGSTANMSIIVGIDV